MVSLAVVYSMIHNSRRLETIGYALSVAFLQQLIAGEEDIVPYLPPVPHPKTKTPTQIRIIRLCQMQRQGVFTSTTHCYFPVLNPKVIPT